MHCLIDGDIIRYEVGFASETGWKAKTNDKEAIPPFDFVRDMVEARIEQIMRACSADNYTLYFTTGRTFRYDVAKTRPYKQRTSNKPWHFNNLTVYMRDCLQSKETTYLEADDMMAIDQSETSVICSRDKDLRQVPGWSYGWELHRQPSFGPELITKEGWLKLDRSGKQPKLRGTGLSFFYAQLLMGDGVDTIPGCRNVGPVKAYELLNNLSSEEQLKNVIIEFQKEYGQDWEEQITEQGQLAWIVRKLNENGSPLLWQLGMTE